MGLQQTRTPGTVGGGRKTTFTTALTETSTINKEGLGAIRQEGPNFYKWVKYNSGTAEIAAATGLCVGYVAGANEEVTPDVSDTNNIGAGVLMSVPADGEYCWVQIKGLSGVLAQDVTAGSVGNALTLAGAADGEFDVSAAVTDFVIGALVVSTASNQQVLLDCPW